MLILIFNVGIYIIEDSDTAALIFNVFEFYNEPR